MTDITINIKTGSENSDPTVTATTDSPKVTVPETPIAESSTTETPKEDMKEETTSEKESPKKDDAKAPDMTEEEHAKMMSEK